LGFLNKKLYSEEVRAVLEDVSNGQSFSCVFTDGQEPGGWPATRGFDAITGLGVPSDFQKLLNVLLEA
jgi:tripeptidyl-peptidase-1